MKSLIVGDNATVARLAERLEQADSLAQYQRIQCVLIRATLGSTAAELARLLGSPTATVHVIHSRWAREPRRARPHGAADRPTAACDCRPSAAWR
jgi:DNA-binding transcriptional regulator YiaG